MKKNNSISLVIFKNSTGRSLKWTVKTSTIQYISLGIFVTLSLLGTSVYFSYNTNIQQATYKQLQRENSLKDEKIKKIDERLTTIQHQLSNIIEKEQSLELLLGEAKIQSKKKKKNYKLKKFIKTANSFTLNQDISPEIIQKKSEYLQDMLTEYDEKLNIHLTRSQRMKSRFESTPSIRPVYYGRIMSRYGWRNHPISGKKKFHKGIDIASWTGASIRVTADGIVEYAGWSRTYGYLVVVYHDYGYRTIYAHCSQILTKKADFVKKGQVIAQVGSTGLSTGPHLHYEIKKWNKSVNPLAYLDLDMFTARDRIW